MKMKEKNYTKVWGDRVYLPDLSYSAGMGIVMTMGLYGITTYILGRNTEMAPNVASGYALIGGIAGCFISGAISSCLFKPKRELVETGQEIDLAKILEEAGSSLEAEAGALSQQDQAVIQEMEDLELYHLLALIPETSANYKPEYKELAKKGGSKKWLF